MNKTCAEIISARQLQPNSTRLRTKKLFLAKKSRLVIFFSSTEFLLTDSLAPSTSGDVILKFQFLKNIRRRVLERVIAKLVIEADLQDFCCSKSVESFWRLSSSVQVWSCRSSSQDFGAKFENSY